jgi:hypothetical protein
MESLLDPVELNRETTQALDEIRSGAENALYGTASADAEEKLHHYILPLIEGSGLPNLQVMHYRWYLRELARLWRTRTGRDLAFHLELCIRKWVGLGLEPRTLQFLICEAHERLKGQETAQPQSTQSSLSQGGDMTETCSEASDRGPSQEPNDERTVRQGPQGSRTINDGTLPGIMAGPRPPVEPDSESPDSSIPEALR